MFITKKVGPCTDPLGNINWHAWAGLGQVTSFNPKAKRPAHAPTLLYSLMPAFRDPNDRGKLGQKHH